MRDRTLGTSGRGATAVFAVAVMAGLAACSSGSADPTELDNTSERAAGHDEAGADELPADFRVRHVAATDSAGWVAGRSAGTSSEDPVELWRLDTDGTETFVAELPWRVPRGLPGSPELGSPHLRGVGDLVAAAEVRCDEPEDRFWSDPCHRARARVLFYSENGEVADHDLWQRQDVTPVSGEIASSVTILGTSADSAWILNEQTIFEVTADSGVVREVPALQGRRDCPIDGNLYSMVREDLLTGRAGGDVGSEADLSEQSDTFRVEEFRDGEWVTVDGSRQTIPDSTMQVCTAGGIEVVDRSVERTPAELVARWGPHDGWVAAPVGPGITADDVVDPTGGILQRSDGELLSRWPDGAYEPTGLSLPVPHVIDVDTPSLSAAESSEVIVGCVHETPGLTCAAAERQNP